MNCTFSIRDSWPLFFLHRSRSTSGITYSLFSCCDDDVEDSGIRGELVVEGAQKEKREDDEEKKKEEKNNAGYVASLEPAVMISLVFFSYSSSSSLPVSRRRRRHSPLTTTIPSHSDRFSERSRTQRREFPLHS